MPSARAPAIWRVLGRAGLVVAGILVADLTAYALWPLLSDDPFARRSNEEIRWGMISAAVDPPPTKNVDEYTIGVFGGSVATALAGVWRGGWQHIPGSVDLSKSVGRPLRIVDFGVLSGDEPGQYNALHLVHDRLDAAVFVDGFNDIGALPINGQEGCEFMRRFWETNTRPSGELLQTLTDKHRQLQKFSESWLWKPLRYSALFKYYLYRWGIHAAAEVKEYHRTLGAGVSGSEQELADLSPADRSRRWATCDRLAYQYAQSVHLPLLMFLQPNLHIDGSKPFTPDEEAFRATNDVGIPAAYAEMERRVVELRKEGIPAWSLTQVFHSTSETLYIDSCCHVNIKGSEIMADAISRILLASRLGSGEKAKGPE